MSTPNHDTELEEILLDKYMKIASQFYYEGSDEETERTKYGPEYIKEEMLPALHTYFYKQTLELIKNNVAYPELKSMIDADKLRQAAAERWGQE
jgi:hypothetical protein